VGREDTRNFFATATGQTRVRVHRCLASSVLPSAAIFVAVFIHSREPLAAGTRDLPKLTIGAFARRGDASRASETTQGGGGKDIPRRAKPRKRPRDVYLYAFYYSVALCIPFAPAVTGSATGGGKAATGGGVDFILSSLGARYVRITRTETARTRAHVHADVIATPRRKNAAASFRAATGSNLSAGRRHLADIRGSFQSASLLLAGIV